MWAAVICPPPGLEWRTSWDHARGAETLAKSGPVVKLAGDKHPNFSCLPPKGTSDALLRYCPSKWRFLVHFMGKEHKGQW